MERAEDVEVTALAINVAIPEAARWTDTRRGEVFQLMTLNVRLLPAIAVFGEGRPGPGHLANRKATVRESQIERVD